MIVYVQKNMSEKSRLDKDITTLYTLQGTLRHDTSVIDPVIEFAGNLSDYVDCNYLTIPDFKRSYFVNNIRTIVNGLIEVTCHVDVLSSFKESIRSNRAIIGRQENEWNLYLNDGSFRIYENPMVLTKAFPSGFTRQEFVLAVAGS